MLNYLTAKKSPPMTAQGGEGIWTPRHVNCLSVAQKSVRQCEREVRAYDVAESSSQTAGLGLSSSGCTGEDASEVAMECLIETLAVELMSSDAREKCRRII